MIRKNVSWTSASLPRGGGKRRRNYVTKRCEVITNLHIDTDSEQVELAFELTIRRDMITNPWIDVKPQSEHSTRSPNIRSGNSPDMVGTLHRQFTELLITATACKLTKKGGKETTRKKLIKIRHWKAIQNQANSMLEQLFSQSWAFSPSQMAGAWSNKKTKESSEDNHLRIKNRFPKLQCRRKLVSWRGDGEEAKGEEEER